MCFASPTKPVEIQRPVVNNPVKEATEFALNPLAIERKSGINDLRNDNNPLAINKKNNIGV